MIHFILGVLSFHFWNSWRTSKRKRIAPVNPEKYILSPVDGYIANIKTINIDDNIFTQITIDFDWYGDKNLFAPVQGDIRIKEETNEKTVIFTTKANLTTKFVKEADFDVQSHPSYIEIEHYTNASIISLLPFSSIIFYEKEKWEIASLNYGHAWAATCIKILIHSEHQVIVNVGQNMVGGESILAIKNEQNTTQKSPQIKAPYQSQTEAHLSQDLNPLQREAPLPQKTDLK